MTDVQIVLASGSPRRRQLLSYLFDDFAVVSPETDESVRPGAPPEEIVMEIACRKAQAAAGMPGCGGKLIIAADTLVFMDGKIFGKPENEESAREMLRCLSGRVHRVYTGVCVMLISPVNSDASGESNIVKSVSFTEQTDVEFYPLADSEIDTYIATGEPMDKAGAYGIQGKGSVLVKGIHGDFYNVMGLPLSRLHRVITHNS